MEQERHELQFPNMPRNTEEHQLTSGLELSRRRLRLMKCSMPELADVEANPLGELFLPGMSDARKKRVKHLAFMLMMHTKNRAMLMQLLQCLLTGIRGRALEEWECLVRQYEAQNLDTLRDTIKAATLAHNRVVQIRQTERDETAGA